MLHHYFIHLGFCIRSNKTNNTKSIYSMDVLFSGRYVSIRGSEGQRTSNTGTFLSRVKVSLSYLKHTLRDSTAPPFSFNQHKIHWPTLVEFLHLHFLLRAVELTHLRFLRDLFILKFSFIEMLNDHNGTYIRRNKKIIIDSIQKLTQTIKLLITC